MDQPRDAGGETEGTQHDGVWGPERERQADARFFLCWLSSCFVYICISFLELS